MSSDTPSDTPRTTSFLSSPRGLGTGYYQAIDFARQLERELAAAKDEIAALKADLEQARVQLAGCGAVALANTTKSLQKTMATPEQYGYSDSLKLVHDAVCREIALRDEVAALKAEKADMLVWLEDAKAEVRRLNELLHKQQGMANEVNLLVKENKSLAASLTQAREALRPFANYACEPMCNECHNCKAKAAIDGKEGES